MKGSFRSNWMIFFLLAGFFTAALLAPQAAEAKIRWKTSSLAPKDVGYYNYVVKILFPFLNEACEGQLVIKGHWGGVMGDDKQALQFLRVGQLQAAGMSGQGTFTACPEVAVVGLPFLFNDYEEVEYVKEHMIDTFDTLLKPRGLKILGWLDQDFDETYSTVGPLASLEDFKGVQFATWFGPLEGRLFKRLGAVPVPIDPMEIPSSIRMGAVDGVVAPSIWVVGTQLFTTIKYVNPLKIRYSPAFFVASEKAFTSLPKKYQKNIDAKRLAAAKAFNAMAHEEIEKYLEAMIKYGVKKTKSTPLQIEGIRRATTPLWYELSGVLYPPELLDEVLGYLAEYRAKKLEETLPVKSPPLLAAKKPAPKPKPATKPKPAPKPAPKTIAPAPKTEPKPEKMPVVAAPKPETKVISKSAEILKNGTWKERVLVIKRVQAELKARGYYPSKIDGIIGPISYRGIKNFRKDNHLPVNGRIDARLLDALGIE